MTTNNTKPPNITRPPITFPPPPPNETVEERKKRQSQEREAYVKDLIERKYPELRQDGVGLKNAEVCKRSGIVAQDRKFVQEDDKTDKIQLVPSDLRADDPRIFELNPDAARMVSNQVGYYVQMAHKARSPKDNVPWVRFIGCETTDTIKRKPSFGQFLKQELHKDKTQQLSIFGFDRAQTFMVCVDERHQYDAGTDKRIKRLLGLYQNEFDDQRTKFQQHRKSGLTEDEHKTRSSFFAKETAWREAKKRHDAKEAEKKKDETSESDNKEPSKSQNDESSLYLRNHQFPFHLKQEQYNFVVVSYFRDLLAFQRCFHDLSLSLEEADFQPVLIAWAFTETMEDANNFRQLTQCNHPYLQKSLYVLDLYKWVPLDSENLNNVPITYANKYQNEIMQHRDTNERFTQEYHQWERERYGEEAEFEPIAKKKE